MKITEIPSTKDWVTVTASLSSIEKGFNTTLAMWKHTSGMVREYSLRHDCPSNYYLCDYDRTCNFCFLLSITTTSTIIKKIMIF
jgi:hypothetical protein